jgi:hypothetical protein
MIQILNQDMINLIQTFFLELLSHFQKKIHKNPQKNWYKQ